MEDAKSAVESEKEEQEVKCMNVVIVGGHDCMVCQYKKICKNHKCKAKVFTQMTADMDKKLGSPDVFILFTGTVSHKMVKCALDQAKNSNAQIIRSHTSSGTALEGILRECCAQ